MIMSFELTKPGLWLLYTQDYVTMPHVELQPLEKQASHTNANVSTGGNTSPKTNHTSTHISTQSCIFFLVYGRGCPSSCSCKHEQDPIFLLSQDARLPCCLTFPHTAFQFSCTHPPGPYLVTLKSLSCHRKQYSALHSAFFFFTKGGPRFIIPSYLTFNPLKLESSKPHNSNQHHQWLPWQSTSGNLQHPI